MIECYNLDPEVIYNWDEKGFLIGIMRKMKCIVSQSALKKRKLLAAQQDGSKEFIS
jgi:hypothetical protein